LQAILDETSRMDEPWPACCGEYAVYDAQAGLSGAIVMLSYLPCGARPYSDSGALGAIPMPIDKLSDPYGHVTRSQWLEACFKRGKLGMPAWEPGEESQASQCNYYQVLVARPQNPDQNGVPYILNCEDMIQALEMTFDEGCETKSLFRRCRARQGFAKAESTAVRDAAKAVHYAKRILAYEESKVNK